MYCLNAPGGGSLNAATVSLGNELACINPTLQVKRVPAANTIKTFHKNRWQTGNVPVMGSADHGTWLGTLVFDGARQFDGVAPDLQAACLYPNNARMMREAHSKGFSNALACDAMGNVA